VATKGTVYVVDLTQAASKDDENNGIVDLTQVVVKEEELVEDEHILVGSCEFTIVGIQ
jgi:hypothetical protein